MNTATRLIADVLRVLDAGDVAQSLCGTASAIVEFCNTVQNHPIRSALEQYGFSLPNHQRLDAYTLPDAVWTAICRRRPHLYRYPLGEAAERAAKKTLLYLSLRPDEGKTVAEEFPADGQKVQRQLRRSISTLDTGELLTLLLAHYLFEMSVDCLRRPRKSLRRDFGYWYHFSGDGALLPLDAERELRQSLASQCEEKAREFLPFLSACLEELDAGRIREGLTQVFGPPASTPERGQASDRAFVNVVVGPGPLDELRGSYPVAEEPLRLVLYTKRRNVSHSIDDIASFLRPLREGGRAQSLHPLVKDLLDVAAVVYMSDRYVKRERHLGRRMGILMPVRYPDVWSKARLALERAVSFLARDDFSIQFIEHKERGGQDLDFPMEADERKCISLLSGGLDSAAGAVWALEQGLEPVFVSHYAGTRLAAAQRALVGQLEKVFAGRLRDGHLQHLSVYVSKSRTRGCWYALGGPPKSAMVQHLRSFLFLSLASAVALELGIRKVYMFEHGPVALNPLISEALINTRTAHPHFLALYRRFIESVFGVNLDIETPFLYHTKGEVAGLPTDPRWRELVARTESCWYVFRVPWRAQQQGIYRFKGKHDGDCLPCIIRRVAVDHAGLWEQDAGYLVDIFNEFPDLPRHAVTRIADLLRFCQNVRTLSDAELLLRAPDFSVCAEGADPRELIAMYRRHAEEVVRCFQKRSNEPFRETFAPILTVPPLSPGTSSHR